MIYIFLVFHKYYGVKYVLLLSRNVFDKQFIWIPLKQPLSLFLLDC